MIDKLSEMIKDYVEYDEPITPETTLREDLGLSSLDLINIAVEIEEKFGIEMPDKEINGMNSMKDLLVYIEMKQ